MLFKRLSRRRGKDATQQTQFIITFKQVTQQLAQQLASFESFQAFVFEPFEQPFVLQLASQFVFAFAYVLCENQSQPAQRLERVCPRQVALL